MEELLCAMVTASLVHLSGRGEERHTAEDLDLPGPSPHELGLLEDPCQAL